LLNSNSHIPQHQKRRTIRKTAIASRWEVLIIGQVTQS
jgi:hypothetical protein